MICMKCGARLLDTDQFCPECGAKIIKERRCPDCGAVLREGTKFCHKCGRLMESTESPGTVPEETLDIPIDAIERTIVSETEAKIRAERGDEKSIHRKPVSGRTDAKRAEGRSAEPPGKKKTTADAPPKKRKPVCQEEEDWDDEEEEEGVDVITVMTAVVGCVLLVVIAFLAYNLYRQYVPKDYEKIQEQQTEEQEEQEATAPDDTESARYTLTIISNVNVRDNPSTEGTNILKVAKPGETYECYGSVEDGNWYEIRLEDGTTGYVFQEYVTVEE